MTQTQVQSGFITNNAVTSTQIADGSVTTAKIASSTIIPILNGGTGATTAASALSALLPNQTGNAGKALFTNGSLASWATLAQGISLQVFSTVGGPFTYTPTAGKTTFLVFATGGGGGGGADGGGGGGGTALRLYSLTEMGGSALITIGNGGNGGVSFGDNGDNGGNTVFDPAGTGLTITGQGGEGNIYNLPRTRTAQGGGAINSQINIDGNNASNNYISGYTTSGGCSFFAGGAGGGGNSGYNSNPLSNGNSGTILILEW